ncbi:MAG: sugar transferase [Verrucomicrobia bacterium]|nr:sugar transferase [Verrucomicrobiota bacterium]
MRLDTHLKRDWGYTTHHFLLDIICWFYAFAGATALRFRLDPDLLMSRGVAYTPGVIVAAVAVASCLYVSGMYSLYARHRGWRKRLGIVTICLSIGVMILLAVGSLDLDGRVGRGVVAMGFPVAALAVYAHHYLLHRRSRSFRENGACIVTCPEDQVEALRLLSLDQNHYRIVGCFAEEGLELHSVLKPLGTLEGLVEGLKAHDISRVFCTQRNLQEAKTSVILRRLRYSGMAISSVTEACEEVHQAIPLELIDHEWLLHACGQPGHFYVSKLKRLMDVVIACSLGLFALPLFVISWILVRLTSKGPGLYSQVRVGRFGETFLVRKLRTMRLDAEAGGPQWSKAGGDSRVTFVGGFLRKFRVDEIPQLWNILKGEMSFVGPRPERPEFTDELAEAIPFFRERLLLRPGLTGWAQVCYPYGSSVDDARRKLEFDLYYIKHMSLSLDAFILLDTIKTVVRGGASERRGARLAQFEFVHHRVSQEVSALRTACVAPRVEAMQPVLMD